MMFKRVFLLAVLVAVLAIPTVSANEDLDYHREIVDVINSESTATIGPVGVGSGAFYSKFLRIRNSELLLQTTVTAIEHTQTKANWLNYDDLPQSDWTSVTISDGAIIGTADYGYFKFSSGGNSYLKIWIENIEWSSLPPTTSGDKALTISGGRSGFLYPYMANSKSGSIPAASDLLITPANPSANRGCSGSVLNTFTSTFHNKLDVTSDDYNDIFTLTRDIGGIQSKSILYIKPLLEDAITDDNNIDVFLKLSRTQRPYEIALYSPATDKWYLNTTIGETPKVGQPCTINVYDADTRLPLSGAWDYYVVVQGSDPVSGSASGAFKVVNLPVTSILKPHLLYVEKDGYEMTPGFVAIDVPAGGREIKIYMTPLETSAPEGSSVVTFSVTDIETGTPRGSCLVNVDGFGKYAGASGTAWFVLPENTTHQWVVTAEGYWPIGGNFTLDMDDLTIPVTMTKKTSDLPRPPLPDLPNFPVIHPSLDPAGFRMQILSVPLLGGLASPLLDTVDSLGVGLNDMATTVLDVLTLPADEIVGAVSSVGQNLIDTATPYLTTSSLLLQVIGSVVSCIPEQVCGLVTFGLLLDIVRILLWGPA